MRFIGCSGWSYDEWQGKFYPPDLPKSRRFGFYAETFNTVELNYPFYHFPKPETVRKWYRESPPGFRFTLKVNRSITHIRRFNDVGRLLRDFYRLGELLQEKMGCFLFQLPPSMKYTPESLQRVLDRLSRETHNVVEFRHRSWFCETVYEAFRHAKVTFCIVSAPRLPDEVVRTADDVYVRFHGTRRWYADNYREEELRRWADRLSRLGARTLWAYFNNDVNAYAPHNALTLRGLLERRR